MEEQKPEQQHSTGGRVSNRNKRVNNNATKNNPKKKGGGGGGGTQSATYQPKEQQPPSPPKQLPDGPQLEYFDSHCHLDLILDRHNIPHTLEALKEFFDQNMADTAAEGLVGQDNKKRSEQKDAVDLYSLKGRLHFGGCLQVACFLPGFDATMEFVKMDCVYASFGMFTCILIHNFY